MGTIDRFEPCRLALRLLAVAATCAGGVATAQDTIPQTIPGLDGFSLPSSRPTPRATPTPAPTSRPRETPSAAPTAFQPTRTVAPPVARTLPTPRQAALVPARTLPRPTPVATPRTGQIAQPTAAAIPQALPTAAPPPVAQPTAAPPPVETIPAPLPETGAVTPLPTPRVIPTPTPRPWVALDRVDPVALLALGLGAVIAAVFGLGLWWRNRPVRERVERRRDRQHELFALGAGEAGDLPPPPPPPPASPPPAPPPPAAPVGVAGRATLEIELLPKRAGTNLLSASVEYQLVVRNTGTLTARGVRLDMRLFGAGADQDALLAAIFADPVERPVTAPFDVPPATELALDGMVMHPKETLALLDLPGEPSFVPVVAVNLHYGWAAVATGQIARAFVIGIDRGGDKLQPFRVDSGRMYDAVAALPYGVGVEG